MGSPQPVRCNIATLPPGRHRTYTPGLYLYVSTKGVRRWIFRYSRPNGAGVSQTSLGPFPAVSLAKARGKLLELRGQLADGTDPVHAKRQERVNGITFAEACEGWITTNKPSWRSEGQLKSVNLLLKTHGAPLANTPVEDIVSLTQS